MKRLLTLLSAASLAMTMLVLSPAAASAATSGHNDEDHQPSVVGTINGTGASDMLNLPPGMNKTTFVIHAKLFSDHTARGTFICVDLVGDPLNYQAKIFGEFTSWSRTGDGPVSLIVADATIVAIPGGPQFPPQLHKYTTVTIQSFGGAGVGHWTMDVLTPNGTVRFCVELLTSGRLVGKGELFRDQDENG
jgi:hypothetical protein